MSSVDDRIVEMKFDNAAFQQKLGDTLKSLDDLKKGLNFDASKKGLSELADAGNKFNMGNMAGAIEGVSGKFLALTTVGITALATLTTKAISAASQFVSAFTFKPIMDGFQEFETNMNSIQTILANTESEGTTLDDVNGALDKLNEYSDKTIYNFSEMARNIGTFTAAGVKLDDSVNAIKGIANLAAISGSNSQQASTAMYQLSQALAAGKVNLMDWNSVVTAGMGGKVFKEALFETGKAMGKITDVPLGASFEEWEKKGGTFREQMEKGWLTADVLRTTLGAFSGDLDEAALKSVGFSDEMARHMVDMGKKGQLAAQDIKTFTQLMSTLKESVGSGWSQTFRTVIGNFEESKTLWTSIYNAIGNVVTVSADARNKLLEQWKFVGGRDDIIQSLKNSFEAFQKILGPIKDGFREIFPAKTFQDLKNLTQNIEDFTQKLIPSGETMGRIADTSSAFFAILKIGWQIIKEVGWALYDLLAPLKGVGGGAGETLDKVNAFILKLEWFLVERGGIYDFFQKLREYVKAPAQAFVDLKDRIVEFFTALGASDKAGEAVDRIGSRFGALGRFADNVGEAWDRVSGAIQRVKDVLGTALGYIVDWFKSLGQKIAEATSPDDYDAAVDAVNVGLLGGIALLLKKFLDGGINLDFGNGIMEKIGNSFDTLTGTLKSMQQQVKSKTLLQIAGAVGILTVSVVALSMIDSAALTKALTAISVSFGLLIGSMKALDKLNIGLSTTKLGALAGGMIAMAIAVDLLTIAVTRLSKLSWEDLAKGLLGVVVLLGALTASTNLIAADTSGMIRAGVGMIAISIALNLLALAVKSFADLSWGEMAKGLAGVGIGLGIIVLGMNLMPTGGMVAAGAGMILIAAGLRLLAVAVQAFADISWGEMAKGFVGVGAGLLIIAGAMQLMPVNLPITAAGMLILSVALNVLALAVRSMGSIPFGELAKGIGGLAVVLGVLAIAMTVMTGTAAGAAALLVASAALMGLTLVLKILGTIPITQLVTGIAAIAAVLTVLGLAALIMEPIIPALMGLGVALALIGGSFALFGAGAFLVAKGLQAMAESGKAGAAAFVGALKIIVAAVPNLSQAFFDALKKMAEDILNAMPVLIGLLTALLSQLLETVITLVPQIVEALGVIISGFLTLIREKFPEVLATGIELLITLLTGIRDSIGEIVPLVVEIFANFAKAVSDNMQTIVDSAVLLITSFLNGISARIGDVLAAGLNVLINFLLGISDNISKVIEMVTLIIETFLAEVAGAILRIVESGLSILVALLKGIADNINKVVDGVTEIITKFLDTIAENEQKIIDKGFEVLIKLLSGITNNLVKVTEAIGELIARFIGAIGENAQKVFDAGAKTLVKFLDGVGDDVDAMLKAGVDLVVKILEGAASNAVGFVDKAGKILVAFLNGIADAIEKYTPQLQAAGRRIAGAILDGVTGGLAGKLGGVLSGAIGVGKTVIGGITKTLGINSPSKVMIGVGESIIEGLVWGMSRDRSVVKAATKVANRTVAGFQSVLSQIHDHLGEMGPIEPVISPVLNMDNVLEKLRGFQGGVDVFGSLPGGLTNPIWGNPAAALRAHQEAANRAVRLSQDIVSSRTGQAYRDNQEPRVINFTQNNYSPDALSTNDIYRNTKSLVAITREKLGL